MTISFEINNRLKMTLEQDKHDNSVVLSHMYPDGSKEAKTKITPGDFVMLINLYRYVKENDIQNDFINPYGHNKEV